MSAAAVLGKTTGRAHGRAKYNFEGCRCEECRRANAQYESDRQRRHRPYPWRLRCVGGGRVWLVLHCVTWKEVGRSRSYDEAVAIRDEMNADFDFRDPIWATRGVVIALRKHLKALLAAGLGARQIAKLSGVTRRRLQEIIVGHGLRVDRPIHRRIKSRTAERLLAVQVTSAAPGAIVDGTEAWRMVGELRAIGMTKSAIARSLGRVTPALQLRRGRVLKRSVEAIRELHDRIWKERGELREICGCPGQGRSYG